MTSRRLRRISYPPQKTEETPSYPWALPGAQWGHRAQVWVPGEAALKKSLAGPTEDIAGSTLWGPCMGQNSQIPRNLGFGGESLLRFYYFTESPVFVTQDVRPARPDAGGRFPKAPGPSPARTLIHSAGSGPAPRTAGPASPARPPRARVARRSPRSAGAGGLSLRGAGAALPRRRSKVPLPRPMATQEPDLTPRLSPLRAGAPPTSASACRLGCAHAHVRWPAREPRGGGPFRSPQTLGADWAAPTETVSAENQ